MLVLLCICIICIIFHFFQDIPIKTGCKKFQYFIISIHKHPGIYKLPNYFSDQSHETYLITIPRWYENCRTHSKENCMRIRMIPQKGFQPEHCDIFFCKLSTFNFSNFSCIFLIFFSNLNYNCSSVLDLTNLQE